MNSYGDIKNIRKRKRYLKRLYRRGQDKLECEKIGRSLIATIQVLHFNTYLFNFTNESNIGFIIKEYFTLVKDARYKKIKRMFRQEELYMDATYLSFLIKLANYVADGELRYFESPVDKSFHRDAIVNGAKSFYDSLQDDVISPLAKKILSDTAFIYFREGHKERENLEFTLFDYVYYKPYICILEHHDLRDLFTLIRQCALGIKFYMEDDLHYDCFQDVCAYVMESLAFSYFESEGMDSEKIAILKKQRECDFTSFASDTLLQIHSLPGQQGLKNFLNPNINELVYTIPQQLKIRLIQIQSYVMARGLVQQIQLNKKIGLNNLKTLMRMNISNDRCPNFEEIGLSNDVLLALAQEISIQNGKIYSEVDEKKR